MPSTTLLTLLALTASTIAQSNFFYITNWQSVELHDDLNCHNISFTVSTPKGVPSSGGNDPYDCLIEWTGSSPPACYTQCHASGGLSTFWTRVVADTYNSIGYFDLDVVRYHSYRNQERNNLTVAVNGADLPGLVCTQGGDWTGCVLEGVDGYNATYSSVYNGAVYVGYEPDNKC
ncbi:hypothetical protein HII31_11990 [Pseudocercospora fuligena]|uniref:Uncharacterized protein n=1 Tax=Pseudocercospora fuligena TaxID=685502 RepID=A0A8H6R933_9PEZI|nr:hypothetical protein HII31_11990 [Pseudocercospora fuligena]